jgi:hypothetical protein
MRLKDPQVFIWEAENRQLASSALVNEKQVKASSIKGSRHERWSGGMSATLEE